MNSTISKSRPRGFSHHHGLLAVLGLLTACGQSPSGPAAAADAGTPPQFTGTQICAGCHSEQYAAWRASHHALAMQVASPDTVLGDFSDRRLEHFGELTRFFRRGAEFWVETPDSQGQIRAVRVEYTIGVYPLQQYLVAQPGGRYQAMTMAWDARPHDAGGQRWFHLQPDEPVRHGDALHWTGPYYNWNSRCAECHTTGLRKGFDAAANSFATKWREINVACEACHGPGSEHLRWAARREVAQGPPSAGETGNKGFAVAAPGAGRQWIREPGAHTARAVPAGDAPGTLHRQLDVCGPCHSRRQVIAGPEETEQLPAYHDAYVLSLPRPPLYHADGQVRDEVFELGSFLQSRMHAAGVVCSNCHEPHSLRLRAPGNNVCAQCHDPQRFDVPSHHHHVSGSKPAMCTSCHMPATTFMGVDSRLDHSLRIPRPDLTVSHGTPNACTSCHEREGAAWAAKRIALWRRDAGRPLRPHFSEQLVADDPASWRLLATDPTQPAIARAAALARLAEQPHREGILVAASQVADADPLVRQAALANLHVLPLDQRTTVLAPVGVEPVRAVRLELARLLAAAGSQHGELHDEYISTLQRTGDMPGNQVSLGLFRVDRGELGKAEEAYNMALRQDPHFVSAHLNLADLYRAQGREADAHRTLLEALRLHPQLAAVHHALGLQRVRVRAVDEALAHLRRAHELAPDDANYGFVYAVALHDTGARQGAIVVLKKLAASHPGDARVAQALIDYQW